MSTTAIIDCYVVYHPNDDDEWPDEFSTFEEATIFMNSLLGEYEGKPDEWGVVRWDSGLGANVYDHPNYDLELTFQIEHLEYED